MTTPLVSIILPTYNRAKFLPQALASITSQTFTDWELIIIDDGSTDDTRELIPQLTANMSQPVRYIYQKNQGAYGARNTGLDHATGEYIAMFDSDDEWLPHHLKDCVEGLEANEDVDWVYGACQIVEDESGKEIAPSTFYVQGEPKPFRKLAARSVGALQIIDDAAVIQCMILSGLYCGLQNSVIRRDVYSGVRFEAVSRNEAEDQLFVIKSLVRGHRLSYFDNVHVVYRIHSENSSGSCLNSSLEKRLRITRLLISGYEALMRDVALSRTQQRALHRRLGREYFWLLGYSLLWQNSRNSDALAMFARGLRYWPWDLRCWKTYAVALAKTVIFGRQPGQLQEVAP